MKHEIIKTDNYLLVVDESEIKEGDLVLSKLYEIIPFGKNFTESLYKKVIAHLPLNGSFILEGVDLLPPIQDQDDVWKHGLEDELKKLPYTKHLDDGQYNDGQLAGFEGGAKWGYNQAKEKYKYTEEDMRKAWNAAYIDAMSIDEETYKPLFFEDFIQSLSQPKMPIGFECVTQKLFKHNEFMEREFYDSILTTTTPEGHTEWMGIYIY